MVWGVDGVGAAEEALLALRLQWRGAAGAELAHSLTGPDSVLAAAADPRWTPTDQAWKQAKRQRIVARALDIQVVAPWDFPCSLQRSKPLPLVLFLRGDPDALRGRGVAIVGSRRASEGAVAWSEARAFEAAQAGWTVISGGARGIDAAAHRGAVAARGRTVVYLGVAADRCYPSEHKSLFLRILRQGGALVSEHAPGEQTLSYHHARRNRFIAAQAHLLLIAEAAAGSGTLGTADYGRRVGVDIRVAPERVGGEREGLEALLAAGRAQLFRGDELTPRIH